ncbi:MAG: hypothetical protein CSA66_07485 [Proteobacteria bacterium]|nr:MAG: hypothetical protein CSA66_07485 [Pseudomonadota bacterium]
MGPARGRRRPPRGARRRPGRGGRRGRPAAGEGDRRGIDDQRPRGQEAADDVDGQARVAARGVTDGLRDPRADAAVGEEGLEQARDVAGAPRLYPEVVAAATGGHDEHPAEALGERGHRAGELVEDGAGLGRAAIELVNDERDGAARTLCSPRQGLEHRAGLGLAGQLLAERGEQAPQGRARRVGGCRALEARGDAVGGQGVGQLGQQPRSSAAGRTCNVNG